MNHSAQNSAGGGIVLATRVTLSVEEACMALGISYDFWQQHIAPELPIVRRGRRKLIPVRALEQWAEQNAERVLDDRAGGLAGVEVA